MWILYFPYKWKWFPLIATAICILGPLSGLVSPVFEAFTSLQRHNGASLVVCLSLLPSDHEEQLLRALLAAPSFEKHRCLCGAHSQFNGFHFSYWFLLHPFFMLYHEQETHGYLQSWGLLFRGAKEWLVWVSHPLLRWILYSPGRPWVCTSPVSTSQAAEATIPGEARLLTYALEERS